MGCLFISIRIPASSQYGMEQLEANFNWKVNRTIDLLFADTRHTCARTNPNHEILIQGNWMLSYYSAAAGRGGNNAKVLSSLPCPLDDFCLVAWALLLCVLCVLVFCWVAWAPVLSSLVPLSLWVLLWSCQLFLRMLDGKHTAC